MSPKEENIIKVIANALQHMSEFDKGYFLGLVVGKAAEKEENKKQAVERG